MSEISMYEAQKKKLQGLCDEHDLTYRFIKDAYPIQLIIKPIQGMDAQITMLEAVEDTGYISPEASMTWIFRDGVLETKVTGGTFTISKTLRTKIEWRRAVSFPCFLQKQCVYCCAVRFFHGRVGRCQALQCRAGSYFRSVGSLAKNLCGHGYEGRKDRRNHMRTG